MPADELFTACGRLGVMTQTLPHTYDIREPVLDGPIRLPQVDLPPAPSAWRRARFAGLVLLGYLYVLGMLGLLVVGLLVVALASLWLLWLLVPLLGAVLPALRLKVLPPGGTKLTADTAPRLLELIERHRRKLKAPRLKAVLLVEDAVACVRVVPRLGILGWNRVYLVLGLPYLLALTPEELEGVIAHELAHVARRRGAGAGLGGSLARWQQLDERLDERRHWFGSFFRPFLRRYLPRLERATLAFSRWREYEADQIAAAVAGDAAAMGLVRVSLLDQHLEETVWDETMRRADDDARPPAPYSLMRSAAREPFRHASARLAEHVRHVDADWTHPTLAQRLRAMGMDVIDPTRLKPPVASAAEVYVDQLPLLIASFDEGWRERVGHYWDELHAEAQELREELLELEAIRGPSLEELRRRAVVTARLEGPAAARRLFDDVLRDDVSDARAHYWVGRALLDAGDERGLGALERAAEEDVHATPEAAATAIAFLVDRGRHSEVDVWRERHGRYAERMAVAARERSRLRPTDAVEPHGLPAETVELVRAELAEVRAIRRAYLVRKRCVEFGDEPLWVVGLRVKERGFRLQRGGDSDALLAKVIGRLEPILGGSLWVVVVEGDYAPLEPAMSAIPDARLLGRRARTARLHRHVRMPSIAVAAFAILIGLGGLISVIEDDTSPIESQAPSVDLAEQPLGVSEWAKQANAACTTVRGHGLDTRNRKAQVAVERAIVAALAGAGATAGSAPAIGLAQRRLAALEEALVFEQRGAAKQMRAALRRHDTDLAASRALTALGAPACASP